MLQPSLTLSFSLPAQNNPKTKQCCTGVCSRDWIMVNITFHASNRTEVPTQVQAPKQTEEGGCSQRLLRGLCCQLTRSRGSSYSSPRETAAFPHWDLFHPTGNKAIREDCRGDWVPVCFARPQQSGFIFFPPGKKIQQRLSNGSADGSKARRLR